MAVVLVEHEIEVPALFGAAAAVLAVSRQARVMHLPARFDTARHADAVQHAVASGGLVASGLCWIERLSDQAVTVASTVEEIVSAGGKGDVLVPVHPIFLEDPGSRALLLRTAQTAGVAVETVSVHTEGAVVRDLISDMPIAWRDAYGRVVTTAPVSLGRPRLPIGLVGAESDHRDVYPAGIASLADAADQMGVELELRFIDPLSLAGPEDCAFFSSVAGILLPGGADMKNVRGQIEAASASLAAGLPTVGLCLGMQTMTTAIAWRAFGRGTANLAEADPQAAIKTFVPIAGKPGGDGKPLPAHRTGEHEVRIIAGTRLSRILPQMVRVRYNHRFGLDQSLLPALRQAGLQVAAEGFGGAVVDAIEHRDHPFFLGMQGHPELSSRDNAPHPLLSAFLAAAWSHHLAIQQ